MEPIVIQISAGMEGDKGLSWGRIANQKSSMKEFPAEKCEIIQ